MKSMKLLIGCPEIMSNLQLLWVSKKQHHILIQTDVSVYMYVYVVVCVCP